MFLEAIMFIVLGAYVNVPTMYWAVFGLWFVYEITKWALSDV